MSDPDAVARAKAIAAKLSGAKRTGRWDSSVENGGQLSSSVPSVPGHYGSAESPNKKSKSDSDIKRVWINNVTQDRPAPHFVSFMKPRLQQIVQDVNQQLSGADENPELSISLEGKGSSEEPPVPGVPVPALHCLITGSPAATFAALPLVEDVLLQAEKAPVSKSDIVLASAMHASRDAVTKAYQPASVAQLIHSHNQVALGENHEEETFEVPNQLVGFIIGRGGENIAKLQAKTGARVQIQQERDLKPGQTQRLITLQANSQESIRECRAMIEALVAERSTGYGGGGPKRDNKVAQAVAQGHAHIEVLCEDNEAGLVIGKQGSTIRQIQEQSGASITVPSQVGDDGKRHISITHPTGEGAKFAQQLVENILQSRAPRGEQVTRQVQIPDKDVGLCIGRGGSIIKHMQDISHCRIQIPPSANVGEIYRVATVSGPPEGVERVEAMIRQICHDQSSQGIFSHASAQYHQQPAASSHSNGSYSAEWAAYHAAAAAAGTPVAASPAPVAAIAAGQPLAQAADAYYEQFFRYAYYYGEPAARAYYGAWSPPVGTPNPYGVNPNGTSPAPAPTAAGNNDPDVSAAMSQTSVSAVRQQASTPAPSPPSDPSAPRETSQRRGVSNLPAWMTKT